MLRVVLKRRSLLCAQRDHNPRMPKADTAKQETKKQPPSIPRSALKFPGQYAERLQKPHTFRWILLGFIVVLIAILAGLLIWLYTLQQPEASPQPAATRPTAEENNEPESTTAEAAAQTQAVMSPSTDLDAIATDLAGTKIIDLEASFADIEAMF